MTGRTAFLTLHVFRIYIVCYLAKHALGGDVWSLWYPTEASSGAANQTLEHNFSYACDYGNVLDVECRVRNLTSDAPVLEAPCNRSYLGWNQGDNSIIKYPHRVVALRFLCHVEDTTNPQNVEDHSLKVNGGFIAMAAGLSVIVPLICVLIIQLRRSKREERERARAARAAADAEAGQQTTDDPPPSYEQLFGTTAVPAPGDTVHSRAGSLDALIDTNETTGPDRRRREAARERELHLQLPVPANSQNGGGSEIHREPTSDGGNVNHGFSSTSVSTISGSQVFDYPLSATISALDRTQSLSGSVDTAVTGDAVDAAVNTPTSSSTNLSSPSSSSSLESTQESPPPLTPLAPPPPYQSPATSRHQVSDTSGNSAIHQVLRRFPGMHISIQDIFSSFRVQQDNENEVPPPSYEEALKILESAKLSTQHILGKIN